MSKLWEFYSKASLASKIRYSYFILLIPFMVFQLINYRNLSTNNKHYDEMIDAAVTASEFSLDFKKDFDYEVYLLIVGNKSKEDSELGNYLGDAKHLVTELEKDVNSNANKKRLESTKKYLNNLETYVRRIEDNLEKGDMYEENMKIWDSDVQIVTELIKETMLQYIYYEIRSVEESRDAYHAVYVKTLQFSLIVFIAVTLLILILSYYIPQSISGPIMRLSKVTEKVAGGDLSVRANETTGAEVVMLNDSLNSMIEKLNDLIQQVTREQERLRKAELELLQSQINPHFLYNTLDTIVWLAEAGKHKKVVEMVESLSDFFRTSLSQGLDSVTIREELLHVKSYLEIQQVRYQDILQYDIDVSEELYECIIPKITLQPLVENALYHGIKNKRGLGTITINGRRDEDRVILEIKDNGIGMDQERLASVMDGIASKNPNQHDIYGLYNVNERIQLKFGKEYGISMESSYGDGTIVRVELPFSSESEK